MGLGQRVFYLFDEGSCAGITGHCLEPIVPFTINVAEGDVALRLPNFILGTHAQVEGLLHIRSRRIQISGLLARLFQELLAHYQQRFPVGPQSPIVQQIAGFFRPAKLNGCLRRQYLALVISCNEVKGTAQTFGLLGIGIGRIHINFPVGGNRGV